MANETSGSIALQSLPAEGDESATASRETLVAPPILGAPPLCDRCSIFDVQSFTKTPNRTRGYKKSDVETSAASNCRFCRLLLESVEGLDPPDPFYISTFGGLKSTRPELYIHMTLSENSETATEKTVGPFGFNRLHIAVGGRFEEVRSHSEVELCVAADRHSPAANEQFISGRCLGADPDDEAYWETIRGWLGECASSETSSPFNEATNGHKKCHETASGLERLGRSSQVMPIRCIKVDANGKPLTLEDTETRTEPYLTLTHRWDSDKPTKRVEACQTTTDNLKDRLNGKGFDDLPQHFLDAFHIAAKLGVEYVWIDSLCIIQAGDNGHDFNVQKSKMAQYYQRSLLTIATTASGYLTKGILKSHNQTAVPWSHPPVQLSYRGTNLPDEAAGHFYVYKRRQNLVDDYWENVRSAEVFNRAWILQEWMLSKRFLWYTPEGMFFECHSKGPRTPAGEQISQNIIGRRELHSLFDLKQRLHWTNTLIVNFWYDAIEVNSTFDIGRLSDRIPAVAGLAFEVANIMAAVAPGNRQHDETAVRRVVYIAGLWLQDIHRGLLWEVDPSAPDATRSVEGISSWSWASYFAPVKFPKPDSNARHEMVVTGLCLEERTESHGEPQWKCADNKVTGMSSEGLFDTGNMFSCLHVEGVILPVWIRGYLQRPKDIETVAFATCYGETPKPGRWRAIHANFDDDVIIGWASVERLPREQNVCADYGSDVLALHVSTRYFKVGWMLTRSFPVIDLLIVKEKAGQVGVYERIGVGRVFDISASQRFQTAVKTNAQLI